MARPKTGIGDFTHPIRLPFAMAAMAGLLTLTLLGPGMTMLSDTESGAGNTVRQIGYTLVFLVAVVAMRPIRHPERIAVIPWPFLMALGWCWLSLIWAIDPGTAVRRLVLTTIIVWSVFGIVRQLGVEWTLLFVRYGLIVLLAANYIAVIFFPSIGLHHVDLDGKWRGVMGHKNAAGLSCALTVIFFAFDRRKMPYAVIALVIALSCVFLWFSESKTSFRLVIVFVAVGWIAMKYLLPAASQFKISSSWKVLISVVCAIIISLTVHFAVQSEIFLNYLADGSGLTGRATIWAALVRYYLNNPLLGAGYGSFWNINERSPIYSYGQGWVQEISEGHNGFLDLLVTIGLPGLTLVILATFIFTLARLVLKFREGEAVYGLIVTMILFCFAHNASESSLFDRDSLGWVFLLLAVAMLWVRGDASIADRRQGRTHRRNSIEAENSNAAGRPEIPLVGGRAANVHGSGRRRRN